METKSFTAGTMRDAIKAVKSEFGQDAVILNTAQKVDAYGSNIFEILASPNGSSVRVGGSRRTESSGLAIGKDDLQFWQRSLSDVKSNISDLARSTIKKCDINGLESSLYEIKNLISSNIYSRSTDFYKDLPESAAKVVEKLQLMDIAPNYLIEISKYLRNLPAEDMGQGDSAFESYQAQAVRWMLKRIKISPGFNTSVGENSIQVIVGGTGVGKSSIVAKIAADFHLNHEKKVLIISYDNKRLGAAEQMRIFSRVIDVPFETIGRTEDLETVLERHQDKDFIFIDTGGSSPKQAQHVEELKAFRDLDLPISINLVLSMTDKSDHLDRTIRAFLPVGIDSLVFTKLDESWSYGEVFNTSVKWGIPLAFFGIGQNITEDIERASRERVIERVFGF